MRSISFDSERNRWRCFHTRGNKVLQPRFPTEREAFIRKLELCAEDGVFPYGKKKKESGKTGERTKAKLPVGVKEYISSKRQNVIVASLPTDGKEKTKEFSYKDNANREAVIRKAAWTRFDHFEKLLWTDAKRFSPVSHALVEKLIYNASTKLQNDLNGIFNKA